MDLPLGSRSCELTGARGPLWISGWGTFFRGGQTRVDGQRRNDLQSNSRLGLGVSIPVRRHAIRAFYTTGLTTRIGGDFDTIGAALQLNWF